MALNPVHKKIIHHSKLFFLLVFEVTLGIISSLSLVLFFFKVMFETFDADTLFLDQQISNFIYSLRHPWLTKFMIFITDFGADYTIIIFILITIFLIWRKHQREVVTFSIILIMGVLLNLSLKGIVQRPRPQLSPLVAESSFSFPSGHAMNSTVFYLALAFYFFHFTRNKKLSLWATLFSFLIISLIGFSRVYLGVHYPSDILAGFAIGLWWLVTAILISKTVDLFKIFKAEKNL